MSENFRNLWGAIFSGGESTGDRRLDRILRRFEARERACDSTEAHVAWLASSEAAEEIACLVKNYEKLSAFQRREVSMELTRTGSALVVPLAKKALEDPKDDGGVLSGIFFASRFSNRRSRFGKEIAPHVVAALGKYVKYDEDRALALLPRLDPELAIRVLFNDEYLAPTSPFVVNTLESCTEAGLAIPLTYLETLLEAWETERAKPEAPPRVRRGYFSAVRALALTDPQRANEVAESIVQRCSSESHSLEEVPLSSAGLVQLYDVLCDVDEKGFPDLPEPAQIYFAVAYFGSDWSNGGIGQALSNSSGDFFPLVKMGYRVIGDLYTLDLLEWMCRPFGPDGPARDRQERKRQMEMMSPNFWDQEEELRESWKPPEGDPGPSSTWLLNRYAARNAEVLRPLVDSLRRERESSEPVR